MYSNIYSKKKNYKLKLYGNFIDVILKRLYDFLKHYTGMFKIIYKNTRAIMMLFMFIVVYSLWIIKWNN